MRDNAFNKTWWSFLSNDTLVIWQHLPTETTGHHVVLKASSCLLRSLWAPIWLVDTTFKLCDTRSHYSEKASAFNFKDTTAPRFGHNDVVFDLVVETHFWRLIVLLSNFSKLFSFHWTKIS